MSRRDKLFIILVTIVFVGNLIGFYKQNLSYVSKPQEVKEHRVIVTVGLLLFAKNEHEIAAVIGHELAHIELGHTVSSHHGLVNEYHADLLSVYYMKKAGYNPCGAHEFWERMSKMGIRLKTTTHPLSDTRAKYMDFKGCKNLPRTIGGFDVFQIYKRMSKNVRLENRNKLKFMVYPLMIVNAFAGTIMGDVK